MLTEAMSFNRRIGNENCDDLQLLSLPIVLVLQRMGFSQSLVDTGVLGLLYASLETYEEAREILGR